MKIHDLFEGKPSKGPVPDDLKNKSQGMIAMRDIGGYDRFYHMNRLSMALAMADGANKKAIQGIDPASFVEKFNVAFPYTDIEDLMMYQAMATIPTDGHELAKRSKSKESPDTNTTSPVSNWNKKAKKS
jgi:hypothetical protein